MINPNDYYFSTPQMFQETEEDRVPITVITAKTRWDNEQAWDCISNEYRGLPQYLFESLGMVELMENIYEPTDISMDCDTFKSKLTQAGFAHHPELDQGLTEWIREYEEEGF